MTAQTDTRADVYELLEDGIAAITDSESFQRYLSVVARLHRYSWSNVVLIWTQKPDASIVAGYRRWQQLGRQVRQGERGIRILAPVANRQKADPDDEHSPIVAGPATRFRAAAVFDVSQTDGEPIPVPPRPEPIDGTSPEALRVIAGVSAWLSSQRVQIVTQDTGDARGWYDSARRLIALHSELSDTERAKVLAHEAAHYAAGHRPGIDTPTRETVAEAVAYAVMSAHGIDTGGYSFAYIAGWSRDVQVLRGNLAVVQQITHQLIEAVAALP